ncbi:MAG TPA: alpha/beta hydrolase [Candidatus Binataceae bacterium]|nr:alpha/beta hydrolase [Candidatus Binataceae bacterium]
MAETTADAMAHEFDIEEVEYLRHNGEALIARLFKPRGRGPFPAVIDAHGGAWCGGHRTNNDPINAAMARAGVVVASLDFRVPPQACYPGSVADLNYGIRWLKAHAADLGSAPQMVGAMGTSSGGHLVVLAAGKPEDPRYRAIPMMGNEALDARVAFLIVTWPVISPLGRYQYLKEAEGIARLGRARAQSMIANHDRYWLSEAAMAEGDPGLALERGDPMELPPLLYVQNPDDPLHPRANLERFVAAYRKAGGEVEIQWFEGDNYDLLRSDADAPAAQRALRAMSDFAHRHARRQ